MDTRIISSFRSGWSNSANSKSFFISGCQCSHSTLRLSCTYSCVQVLDCKHQISECILDSVIFESELWWCENVYSLLEFWLELSWARDIWANCCWNGSGRINLDCCGWSYWLRTDNELSSDSQDSRARLQLRRAVFGGWGHVEPEPLTLLLLWSCVSF